MEDIYEIKKGSFPEVLGVISEGVVKKDRMEYIELADELLAPFEIEGDSRLKGTKRKLAKEWNSLFHKFLEADKEYRLFARKLKIKASKGEASIHEVVEGTSLLESYEGLNVLLRSILGHSDASYNFQRVAEEAVSSEASHVRASMISLLTPFILNYVMYVANILSFRDSQSSDGAPSMEEASIVVGMNFPYIIEARDMIQEGIEQEQLHQSEPRH